MNDRLAELRGAGGGEDAAPHDVAIDIDSGGGAAGGGGGFMEAFFNSVNEVKDDIDAIKNACKELDPLTHQAMVAASANAMAEARQGVNDTIARTNKRVAHAKTALQAMRDETVRLKRAGKVKDSEIRVRENLQNTLTRKFVDLAKEYQNRQNKYKAAVRKKGERQVRAVKRDATEQELDAVFEQENGVEKVLQAAILQSGDPVEVANVLQEVKDVYEDVRRLEASILELHKMFMDLALLVEQQGELLDQIEYQVKSAADYVRDANTDIEHAITSAKSIRKRQCCMIGIILTVLGIIIIVIVFFKN